MFQSLVFDLLQHLTLFFYQIQIKMYMETATEWGWSAVAQHNSHTQLCLPKHTWDWWLCRWWADSCPTAFNRSAIHIGYLHGDGDSPCGVISLPVVDVNLIAGEGQI